MYANDNNYYDDCDCALMYIHIACTLGFLSMDLLSLILIGQKETIVQYG